MEKLKVVQINGTYGYADSTGRTTREMHEWFCKHDIDSYCFVTAFNDDSKENSRVRLYGNRISFKIHALLSRVSGLQGYFSGETTKRLIYGIQKIKPHVIILRVLHNNSICFPKLFDFLRENDIAVVLVLHDCFFFTGHCNYFTRYQCGKWKDRCFHCPAVHSDNVSWFFDTSERCFTDKKQWFHSVEKLGVIGVSDWITGEAEKSFLNKAKVVQRIYNWIDMETFRPKDKSALRSKYGYTEETVILLGVASSWSDEKGLSEIIKIAEELSDTIVLLVGNFYGDTSLLPQNVILAGIVREVDRLADYYAMADIFLNPSVQETFGKTTAEAISCGTPVVAYQTTACTELVGNDRGMLVKLGNKEQYVNAVKECIQLGKSYFTDDLRDFAESNFDMECNIKQYIEVFSILQNS